jgi:hypothetical protein
MFEGLLHRAQHSLDVVLTRFLGRAAVAVPLLVALGFGTAALTVKLSAVYGQVTSYVVMAVIFAAVGGVVAAIVSSTTEIDSAEAEQPQENTATAVTDAVAPLLDRDLLMTLLTTAGPIALPRLLAMTARHLPLLVMAGLVAIFFLSRTGEAQAQAEGADSAGEPEAPAATT